MTDTAAFEDRRREARLSPGDVECEIEGARFVHVLGLTVEGHGMRVMTDCALPTDRILAVSLELPQETLKFQGRVVWEKEQDFQFTHRFICGIKFVDPEEASTQRLCAFIGAFSAQVAADEPGEPDSSRA